MGLLARPRSRAFLRDAMKEPLTRRVLISETRRRQMLALYALCDELNMELPELGLRFVLSNQDIDCVLMVRVPSKKLFKISKRRRRAAPAM